MSDVLRKRGYLALPFIQALLVYYGVTSDTAAALWVGLASVLLTGAASTVAVKYLNVSREISPESTTVNELSAPCVAMHGSAEPHVLGCEGWRYPR